MSGPTLVRLCLRLRIVLSRGTLLGQLSLNGKLLVAVFLAAGAAVCDCEQIMRGRILRLKFNGILQRRDRFRVPLGRPQASSESNKGVAEGWIQLGCAGEMPDGLVPLLVLLRQRP